MKKVCSLFLSALISIAAFAQEKKDSSVNGGDPLEQMLDYSRPGKYHQLLASLAGTFTFKGSHYKWEYYTEQNGKYRKAIEMYFTGLKEE